jgi:WXXGXW repeat (2 copies)
MIRSLALPLSIILALAVSAVLSGCVDEERVVYVRSVPAPEAAEVVAVAPGPGYYYARGHWEWNGSHYVWKQSRYIRRPHAHAVWVEGHWQSSPQGWYWQAGHWAEAGRMHGPHVYTVPAAPAPAAPPAVIEEDGPPAGQVEEDFATPPQGQAAPKHAVPPAPTYLPPPPPASRPSPPAGVQQRYVAPTAVVGGAEY